MRTARNALCSSRADIPFARLVSQKWSKGKVKEKLANLVLFDKTTYEKMLADVPKQKLITPSIISEKLKVNGSLARKAVKELLSKNLIRACGILTAPSSSHHILVESRNRCSYCRSRAPAFGWGMSTEAGSRS